MKMKTVASRCLALGLAGAMVFSLAACGSGSSSKSSDVTIEVQQWFEGELPDGYFQKICDDFKAETGITVKLITAPWADTKTAITSGAATGTVPDIVGVDGAWLCDFKDQGIITDLTALMKENNFDESLLADQWKVGDSTYALPYLNFGYPMFCNMDILEKAGVSSIPTTWDELAEACKKVTKAGYEAFPINLGTKSPNGICNVVMGMASASGIQMKKDGKYVIDGNADMKEFVEFLKELNDDKSIASGATTLEESQMTSNFQAGNYAFCICSMSMLDSFTEAKLNVECAKIPTKNGYTGKSGMCVASWAFGISETTEHKKEALQFLAYMFGGKDGKDGAICADMAIQKSAFPSSTIADPDFSSMPEQFQTVYGVYKDGYPENQFIGIPQTETVETEMINSLVKYFKGDIKSDALLKEWQASVDKVTK